MKYKLTEKGKEKIGEFLKECQRKREFLLNTGMDTAKQTIFPKEEYILNDINSENHFETNVWNKMIDIILVNGILPIIILA